MVYTILIKSCLFFYINEGDGEGNIFVGIDEHISKYSLNGELNDNICFDGHIFGIAGTKNNIYLADETNVHKIDLKTFTSEIVTNMTCDEIKVCDDMVYANLYKDNSDFNNRKWYILENGEFVSVY